MAAQSLGSKRRCPKLNYDIGLSSAIGAEIHSYAKIRKLLSQYPRCSRCQGPLESRLQRNVLYITSHGQTSSQRSAFFTVSLRNSMIAMRTSIHRPDGAASLWCDAWRPIEQMDIHHTPDSPSRARILIEGVPSSTHWIRLVGQEYWSKAPLVFSMLHRASDKESNLLESCILEWDK